MDSAPSARLNRALDSLEGLSIGDAFGEQFFMSFEMVTRLLDKSEQGPGPPYDFEDDFILRELVKPRRLEFCASSWRWTDDTAMALEVVAELRDNGHINLDSLARRFTHRFLHDKNRGYGSAMHLLLSRLESEGWQDAAQSLFAGKGSYGNGSAMRVPPLVAYFADDFALLIEQAHLSAIVTHSHDEAIAGAIATAIATAIFARSKHDGVTIEPTDFLDEIIFYTPDSLVKDGLIECRDLPEGCTAEQATSIVGSGIDITSQDTVPFCCWCAATQSNNFPEAMWLTVEGLGDRDTTCAIVGGILGARISKESLPIEWLNRREQLVWL